MTNVTMKATDTLHVSAVTAASILPGEDFEVSGHVADGREARGRATRGGGDVGFRVQWVACPRRSSAVGMHFALHHAHPGVPVRAWHPVPSN